MKEVSHLADNKIVKYKRTLFELKDQAHLYFDQIWKFKHCTREEAYKHMAEWFSVSEPEVHMANANEEMCKNIIWRSIQLLNDLRRLNLDFGDKIYHPHYELI